MFKFSVLYPASDGATFDMDYYCNSHIPMVRRLLGAACTSVAVEQGLSGAEPGSAPPFVAMGSLTFHSLADFQAAFAPHAAEIIGDVPNYTNIQPVIQISDVKI